MGEFDVFDEAFAPELTGHVGEADVLVAYEPPDEVPHVVDAVVGPLRTVESESIVGERLVREHREECHLTLLDAAVPVRIGWRLRVRRYTTGDASVWPGQRFTVEAIDGRTPGTVRLTARRDLLTAQMRAGNERGR